jgi:branched-chain amino acid transport system ATP-binding protein
MLSVEHLDVRHGLLHAVRDVSLEVGRGETVALVGANGAGKTTLLRAIAGAHRPSTGRILFGGEEITRVSAFRRVRRGIALVPEGRRLFPHLTVEENLLVARSARREGPWDVDRVLETFPLLRPLWHKHAASLSGGEQQATVIGRALMTNPTLLLLDEVSLGLAPMVVESLYVAIASLIAAGTTLLLVEQDLARAMRVAERVVCLLDGRVVLQGASAALSREQVTEAYFGLSRGVSQGVGA